MPRGFVLSPCLFANLSLWHYCNANIISFITISFIVIIIYWSVEVLLLSFTGPLGSYYYHLLVRWSLVWKLKRSGYATQSEISTKRSSHSSSSPEAPLSVNFPLQYKRCDVCSDPRRFLPSFAVSGFSYPGTLLSSFFSE